jgi:hypothetical protein
MKTLNVPVYDIKPLVAIDDYSLYYFIGIVVVMWVFAVMIALVGWRIWKKKKYSHRREMFEQLSSIDMRDSKRAAYTISAIGRIFEHDNERTSKAYHNLHERLEPYKYAPCVGEISQETIAYYHLYLDVIDV